MKSPRGLNDLQMTAAAVDAFNDMDQVAAQMEAAMDGGSVADEGCAEESAPIRMSKKKKKAAGEDADEGQSLTKADSTKADRTDPNRSTIEETTKLASIIISTPKNETREQEHAVTANDATAVAPIQPGNIAALAKSNESMTTKGESPARIHEPAGPSSKNQVGFKGFTTAVSSRILRKKKIKGSASAPDKRASSNVPPKHPSSNISRKDKLSNLRRVRVLGNMQSKLQAKRSVKSKPKREALDAADVAPGSTKSTKEKEEADLLRSATIATPQTSPTRVEDSTQSSGDLGCDASFAASVVGSPCISPNDLSDLLNENCLPVPPAMPTSCLIDDESADDASEINPNAHGDVESDAEDVSCIKTVACVEDSNENEDTAGDEPAVTCETATGNEEDEEGTVQVESAQNGPETLNNAAPDDDDDSLNMLCATDSHGIIGNSKGAVVVEVSSFDSSDKDSTDHIEVIKCIGLDDVAAMNEDAEGDKLREGEEVRTASASQQESSQMSSQSKGSGPSKDSSRKSGTSESTNRSSNRNGRARIREAAANVVVSQAGRERSRSKSLTRVDGKSRMSFRKKKTVTPGEPDSSTDETPITKGLSAEAKETLRAEEAAREQIREFSNCAICQDKTVSNTLT